ncbi:MAG: TonB-dependent receptor [Litorimonas sp.]
MAINRLSYLQPLLLGVAIIPAATLAAFAQSPDNPIEDEIIVTGLRSVPLSDITSSVSILDIESLNIRNSPFVVDQLRAIPSVAVSRSGSLSGLTQVRIRGAEANHTLVLLNGIEVSDPNTGETDFGLWSGLNVQRIEVARGEQSALYGSDAIGGVVSITTGGEGFNAFGEYGSFDTFRGHAGYQGQVQGLSYGISGAGFTTDGVDTSGVDGGERDGSESYSVSANAALEFNPDVTLSGFTSYRDSQIEFDGFFGDNTDATQIITALTLDAQTGLVNHIARVNYTRVNRENFSGDIFNNETIGERTKFSYSPSINFGSDKQGVTLSALAESENEDFERIDTNVAFGDPNQIASFDSFGVGGEIRGRFNGFVVNGSVRHDDNDNQFDNATTWRLGAAYNFGFGGKLRGSIGEGVKNPTFVELFGFAPANFIGNPDLVPERSQSWEIGYDQTYGNFNASITYFNADLEDEIFTNFGVFPFTAGNRIGDSERDGFEVSAGWQATDAISLSGFASQIDSTNDSGVDEIRVPEWTGSASASWESQTIEGFRIGLALDFVGEQLDTDFSTFDPVTFASPDVPLDSYFLFSATAEYPVTDNLSLTLRGENLFDETVTDVFGSNQPGAGVFIGFRIR